MNQKKTKSTVPSTLKKTSHRWKLMKFSSVTAIAMIAVIAAIWSFKPEPSISAEITVYKSPWCGCCGKWVEHMRGAGHKVTIRNTDNLDAVKKMARVPEHLQSCHTAMIDGYIVEGHVPPKDIKKLLTERPKVAGISVPGMPSGSPGMESSAPEPYNVILFGKDGKESIYARY